MRERNRRAREYSQRCWERRWNRRLWILNALMILLIIGILLWALTLPEAQEPEDVPPPLPAAVQVAVDPDIIPLGSTVTIGGKEYIAADTGVYGYTVDVLMTHEEAAQAGVVKAMVQLEG